MVCILKITIDGCGYWDVGGDFIIFPSEICFNTYIGTDSRDLANGYLLCTYLSP